MNVCVDILFLYYLVHVESAKQKITHVQGFIFIVRKHRFLYI